MDFPDRRRRAGCHGRCTTLSTTEAIPGTGIDAAAFWQGFGALVRDLAPRNKALLEKRDALQRQIDAWHLAQPRQADRPRALYGLPARHRLPASGARRLPDRHRQRGPRDRQHRRPAACRSGDQRALCAECRECALGQPVRCALRHRRRSRRTAAPRAAAATTSSAARASIAKARAILDQAAPLAVGSHRGCRQAMRSMPAASSITLKDRAQTGLAQPEQFVGYRGDASRPVRRAAEAQRAAPRDRASTATHPIGKDDPAGVADVVLEAAITTIQDCEDSIAAVDADDKVRGVSQLARADEGHAGRDTFDKGGQT